VDYHLSIAGDRSGPHTQFRIIEDIREGRLKGDELIWHVGMSDWQPLRTMREFDGFWPVSDEMRNEAEAARKKARAELDRPRPWLRFWARTLDHWWFSPLLFLSLGRWVPAVPPVFSDVPLMRDLWLNAIALLPLLLYVPVEAWLLSRFGSTPGRALMRIQVRRLDGGLPHFSQALRRSFQVYLRGMALGIPLAGQIAMLWSRQVLLQRGVTPWDEANETKVEHGEPESWRFLVLSGIVVGVMVTTFLTALKLAEQMSDLPK
jgi:hypothetical protein